MTDNNDNVNNKGDDDIESIDTDQVETKIIEERKCAPGIKFESGSCITLLVLIEMVNAYNKVNTPQIKLYPKAQILNPIKYKKYLLKKIKERFENVCTGQICWMQQDFIKHMNEFIQLELEKFTLRPEGPSGRFEWLNTININEVMYQYEKIYKHFKFLGTIPMDFQEINLEGFADIDLNDLYNKQMTQLGVVFNLDNSTQSGSHWVALYADIKKGRIYYFDSYGLPQEKRVTAFMNKIKIFCEQKKEIKCDLRSNTHRHQYENSECGVYSIHFILQLLKGKNFDDITKLRIKDKVVNKLRKLLFRNANFKTNPIESNSPNTLKQEKNIADLDSNK